MGIPYNIFTGAFLSKITEFNLLGLDDFTRNGIVDGYMKRALAGFNSICKYDLSAYDDLTRTILVDINDKDIDEIADIVSEGMLVQWMKPYVYRQENLENILNTRDYTTYSPAELLLRISNAYYKAQRDYTNMVREYSYKHGDLSDLHI